MKRYPFLAIFILALFLAGPLAAANIIPANHPYIQYFGRWDFSDPLAPAHGWPGVYIYAEFEGTSIGIRIADNAYYYNVFIDGALHTVFHGTQSGVASYTLASGLADGQHTILFTKRNEYWWTQFTFNGFILDDGKNLLPPKEKPTRKIEFVGDSFTSASGNEYDKLDTPPDPASYTNIYEGFGPITARHFGAQYQMSSISGYGMAVDYQGSSTGTIPFLFDRTLVSTSALKWNFDQWQPQLVVICLGLNDYSGFGGWSGPVSPENKALYKSKYHEFITRVQTLYPGVKILAVAAHLDVLQTLVSEVVNEENAAGNTAIYYTWFPYYPNGYVNGGHPNVATHHQIAGRLITAIDSLKIFTAITDNEPPKFTSTPSPAPFTNYSNAYTLRVQTDTYATVRYSEQDKIYEQMENTFTTTGRREHSIVIPVEHGRDYTLFIRAIDDAGNAMDSSAVVRFSVDTSKVVRNWKALDYDDSRWQKGVAPLGSAIITANKTQLAQVTTAYFRKKFTLASLNGIVGMGVLIKGSDGAIVYLNGEEIQRINMPSEGAPEYNLYASGIKTLNNMVVLNAQNGLMQKLRQGENILAIEVHRSNANPYLAFDSQLVDNGNTFYYRLGAEWSYYDAGSAPLDLIQDKFTVVANHPVLPDAVMLEQNYPNPFNPETTIRYQLPAGSQVRLSIFDITGKEVAELRNEYQTTGTHFCQFSTARTPLPSGLYFYRLNIGNSVTRSKKMLIIK